MCKGPSSWLYPEIYVGPIIFPVFLSSNTLPTAVVSYMDSMTSPKLVTCHTNGSSILSYSSHWAVVFGICFALLSLMCVPFNREGTAFSTRWITFYQEKTNFLNPSVSHIMIMSVLELTITHLNCCNSLIYSCLIQFSLWYYLHAILLSTVFVCFITFQ